MNSSLPVIDDPTHEKDQSVTLPPARGPFDTHDAPLDEARWDAWVAKGRRADQALIEKVRMLALLGVTVGVAAGTVWIFLG
jgi:hypothetical protein